MDILLDSHNVQYLSCWNSEITPFRINILIIKIQI